MKKSNNSKIFFYTGNHNKIAGIADIIDYFKNICPKNHINLTLSSELTKLTDETLVVVEEFSKPSEYLKISQKLDSIKQKKVLVLTEFFDHKENNLNSFITPEKFRFFIKSFSSVLIILAMLSTLIGSFAYSKNVFIRSLKLIFDIFISIFLFPIYSFRGFLILIKYYVFFSFLVINKFFEYFFICIYYLLSPVTYLNLLQFLINFRKIILNRSHSENEQFKNISDLMLRMDLKYNSSLPVKYLKLFFEKYDNSNFSLSNYEYEFYKKVVWIRRFIINYVFYYNPGLNNNLKTGILNFILPILYIINKYYFFRKYFISPLLILNSKIKLFKEYFHNYVYFKIRYFNLMKLINKFDYILKTHEEIKVDKDIIDIKNDVIYFSQFDSKSLNTNFDFKKINFDFSGQFNTYRHKKLKEIIDQFKNYSNIFSTEKLNEIILNTKNNDFISSKKSSETKFSLHIEKSETWPYSSPARYINSLQKNEIPIIIKNFGDIYSTNMAIILKDLIENHLNLNNFINEYFNKIITFKKQMHLNDDRIVENLR